MIQIRPIADEDLLRVHRWRNLPEVARYMYTDHEITESEHREWFRRMRDDHTSRYFIIELDESPVGLVCVTEIDQEHKRCSWGFYLAEPHVRGRGVGLFVEYWTLDFVFNDLGMRKLEGEVIDFNEAVIGMHLSVGFVQEGVLREHVIKDGVAHDVIRIGMLDYEWNEKHRAPLRERLVAKGLTP